MTGSHKINSQSLGTTGPTKTDEFSEKFQTAFDPTGKKSVKFGLGGRSNISLPRIGGSHPVPSLSLLSTERRGTAMYYKVGDCLKMRAFHLARAHSVSCKTKKEKKKKLFTLGATGS